MTALYTLCALVGFAANSILCRLALRPGAIDAASFTSVRLLSGALALWLLVTLRAGRTSRPRGSKGRGSSHAGSWASAGLLFAYALPFSIAYVTLGVATGALILFLCVQATMLAGAVLSGERIHWLEVNGIAVALAGLAHLMAPGLSAPPPEGAALMALAGIAWGLYSLRGRRSTDAIGETASNFARSVPMALAAFAMAAPLGHLHLSPRGLLLASASGILASGAGYAAWFAALPRVNSLLAAALQLTVPLIAAVGGIVLLGEQATRRLVLSALLILGGVGLAIGGRARRAQDAERRAAQSRERETP
ncbi:MAG TPA: DMT family transporter [Candidatus Eisenbacteria bacterium]|nr:DMT family transporter [Candidatus Eisenbacteria bacterium]